MDKGYSRRDFLKKYLSAGSALLGVALLPAACQSGNAPDNEAKKQPAVSQCEDFSGVSENDLNARKKLGYVKESPMADMTCSKCKLYLPPAQGKECGGCMLFKGPVYASGYCTYWSAQT